jgi:hypothetical protein
MLNKKTLDYLFLALGILGSIITLYGLTKYPAQAYFVAGSSLLLMTAIHFNLVFFIALELILIAGHGTILLNIGSIIQVALPLLLCVQLLFFYYISGQLNNIFLLIGIIGIGLHSIAFAYENQWIFLIGSSAIAIYAFSLADKNKYTLLWAALNTIFAFSAVLHLIM